MSSATDKTEDGRLAIVSRFQRSYISALGFTALLLLVLVLVVQNGLRSQSKDAFIINLAGRQRMLSQRIVKEVLLHLKDPARARVEFQSSLEQFEQAHEQLAAREKSAKVEASLQDLLPSKIAYSSSLGAFWLSPTEDSLISVLRAERDFLAKMELLVKAFEREASERVQSQIKLQWGIFVLLLAVLFAEGMMIFRPLVTSLTETLAQLQGARADSEQALEKALESDRLKTIFLANVSHELRTPLNGILGSVQLMSLSHNEEERRESLDIVNRSGDALIKIINDLLDMSKIQSGQFELKNQTFSPSQILSDLVHIEGPLAKGKGLDLSLHLGDGTDGRYLGDPLRVRQVLYNLLSNALKFTAHGEVRLSLAVVSEGLEFQVKDTGLGIPKEDIDKALSPFLQLDAGNERSYQGTGLGLPICSNLLNLMGSELLIEQPPEGGTLCRFVLALQPAKSDDPPPANEGKDAALRESFSGKVLLVEDLPMNQKVALRFLRKLGLEPELACDGQEALELGEAQDFDLIFMDVQMPVLDGLEATRRLRARGVTTPIVALTANASPADEARCFEAGMNDFLVKPLRLNKLRATAQRFLS